MALPHLMFHRASIQRPTPTKGTSGGEIDFLADVYSDLPCCVQPASGTDLVFYNQRNIQVTHTIFTDRAVSVRNGDTITYNGRTFILKGVRNLIELDRVTALDCYEYLA